MSLKATHATVTGEKNNVIIPKLYLEAVGWDYVAAVVLRELVYWSGHYEKEREGWFYREEQDWIDEVHLSRKQVNRGLTVIENSATEVLGDGYGKVIEKSVRKPVLDNGSVLNETRTHYRVNDEPFQAWMAVIQDRILSDSVGRSGNVPSGNSQNGNVPKGSSSNVPKGSSSNVQSGNSLFHTPDTKPDKETDSVAGATPQQPPLVPEIVSGEKTPSPRARGYALAAMYFKAKGVDRKDVHTSRWNAAVTTFTGTPEAFDTDDVFGCTKFQLTLWKYREPGALQPHNVVDALPEWVAKGRPEHEAPKPWHKNASPFGTPDRMTSEGFREQARILRQQHRSGD